MKAIFNREFNSYFTSMLVFLTIFLLLTGVMFYVVNIRFMTARMTNFFSIVNNWALFLLPLLTMRLFSEDRKQKTDQLLLTAPISTKEIVFGKYLAAFGIFMVGVLITLIYPVILVFTGNLPIAETISCYVGFILLCSAILAIVYVIYYGKSDCRCSCHLRCIDFYIAFRLGCVKRFKRNNCKNSFVVIACTKIFGFYSRNP